MPRRNLSALIAPAARLLAVVRSGAFGRHRVAVGSRTELSEVAVVVWLACVEAEFGQVHKRDRDHARERYGELVVQEYSRRFGAKTCSGILC